MNKKRIITIAGRPGSGKSTASKGVAEFLGFEHFSSGDLFRAISRDRGVDVHQSNLAAEKEEAGHEQSIDYLVDQRLREIGEEQDEVVIDSRTAWHWIPESFKVYLNLDLDIAAARILKSIDPVRREHEHVPDDPQEYAAQLKSRLDSESRRYKALYDVNPYDTTNYDLIIDTAIATPEEVQRRIIDGYQEWIEDSGA